MIFTSESDAEVIVHLYEEEGEAAFAALKGMFAIVVADLPGAAWSWRAIGWRKAVYYYADQGIFCCVSELKALTAPEGVPHHRSARPGGLPPLRLRDRPEQHLGILSPTAPGSLSGSQQRVA